MDNELAAATHETRGSFEFENVTRAPAPALGAHVLRYQGYSEITPGPARRRHTPSGDVPMIITLGPELGTIDARDPSQTPQYRAAFVAGLVDSYATTESRGESRGVQVDFTPIGAYLFLGMPMDKLTNRCVGLDDLLGAAGRDVVERMREAPDWDSRFAVVDEFIGQRMARARPASPAVAWAWRKLHDAGGVTSIGELASEIGWSRKHLVARFREQVGLPPKTLARVIRFSRVRRLLDCGEELSWTQIAQRCGYYDQAHFIRDFRQFSGITPVEFVARRLPDGGLID